MMNLAVTDHRLAKPATRSAELRDYDAVRRAIAFYSGALVISPTSMRWRMPPASRRMNCITCFAAGRA